MPYDFKTGTNRTTSTPSVFTPTRAVIQCADHSWITVHTMTGTIVQWCCTSALNLAKIYVWGNDARVWWFVVDMLRAAARSPPNNVPHESQEAAMHAAIDRFNENLLLQE